MIKIFIFIKKQHSVLGLFESYFVTTPMKMIFLMSALTGTCLREQYLMLYNGYNRYWNLSRPDILFHKRKSLL